MEDKKVEDLMSAFEYANSLFNQANYQEFVNFINKSEFCSELLTLLRNQYAEAIEKLKLNINIETQTKTFKNGIELIIYSGGKPEDYVLSRGYLNDRSASFAEEDLYYNDDFIQGVDCRSFDYHEDESLVLKKVKLKLKNGKEFIGMLSNNAIEKLEETKILPLIDGVVDNFFKYTLINLENGKSYQMETINGSMVPLKERFIEGYFASNEGCINLDTMEPLLDKKGEIISGYAFNVTNGVFVVICDDEETLRAYDIKGEILDEIKINIDSCDIVDMWDNNIQIIYENGEFYKIENTEKSKLDFELNEEVDPM